MARPKNRALGVDWLRDLKGFAGSEDCQMAPEEAAHRLLTIADDVSN